MVSELESLPLDASGIDEAVTEIISKKENVGMNR